MGSHFIAKGARWGAVSISMECCLLPLFPNWFENCYESRFRKSDLPMKTLGSVRIVSRYFSTFYTKVLEKRHLKGELLAAQEAKHSARRPGLGALLVFTKVRQCNGGRFHSYHHVWNFLLHLNSSTA